MAVSPNSSSIRINWLYFASRSDRANEPVLICPQLVATARSAMVASSVSPERWLITFVKPARWAISTARIVSVSEPIWLTFTSMEFADPRSMPMAKRSGLVTKRSSPTNWQRSPRVSVKSFQPSQSSSSHPSSMLMIGYSSTKAADRRHFLRS